ncbi:hypothetical protein DRA42_12160 [Ethanoligenens harbinense]|nr:hypothetical protein CXQ68_12125 [Ethanoligenens harbinense YUAN-3]AYF39550.1 hypothetical protein CXP51_12020 [Ethanoligenens harbinense]QCN93129.1 hypothetical protein DRA42_12160 [Ethanoligenens harbinense]
MRFADFTAKLRSVLKVCRTRFQHTKSKVERLVRYVKDNFLPDRRFEDLENSTSVFNHPSTKALKTNLTIYYTRLICPIEDRKRKLKQNRLEMNWLIYLHPAVLVIDEVE